VRYRTLLNEITIDRGVTKICVRKDSRSNKLRVEMWVMEQALIQGLKVPRPISYSVNAHNQEILVMERIIGTALTSQISSESCASFHDIGRQLGQAIRKYRGFGWINPETMTGVYATWLDFLTDYICRYSSQVIKAGYLKQTELEITLEALEKEPLLNLPKSGLVHRDLKPSNIINTTQGAFLIDWECAMLGDPEYDLAVYLINYGHGLHWSNLLSGFGQFHPRLIHLYQISALIGAIDFRLTFHQPVKKKSLYLSRLIKGL